MDGGTQDVHGDGEVWGAELLAPIGASLLQSPAEGLCSSHPIQPQAERCFNTELIENRRGTTTARTHIARKKISGSHTSEKEKITSVLIHSIPTFKGYCLMFQKKLNSTPLGSGLPERKSALLLPTGVLGPISWGAGLSAAPTPPQAARPYGITADLFVGPLLHPQDQARCCRKAANPSFRSCFAGLDVTQSPPIHHNGKRAPLGYLGLTGMEMSSALTPRHWTAFGIHPSAGELQPAGRTWLPLQEAGRDAFGAARTYL